MNATTIRLALVALLLAGGVARLASASTPAHPATAPHTSGHVCALGTSC